jgi:hypothetical protein
MEELQVISRINDDFYKQFTKYNKYYVLPTSFFDFMDDTDIYLNEIKLQKEKLQKEKLQKENEIIKYKFDKFMNKSYINMLKKLRISEIYIINIFDSIFRKIQLIYKYKNEIYCNYTYNKLYKYKKYNKIDIAYYKLLDCYKTYNRNILLSKTKNEQVQFIKIIKKFEIILSQYADKIIFIHNELFNITHYINDFEIKHIDNYINKFFNRNKNMILF